MATVDDGQSIYINNQYAPLKDKHSRLVIRVFWLFCFSPWVASFKYSPRSLTARPWKMDAKGRRSFPCGSRYIFRGKLAVKLPVGTHWICSTKGGGSCCCWLVIGGIKGSKIGPSLDPTQEVPGKTCFRFCLGFLRWDVLGGQVCLARFKVFLDGMGFEGGTFFSFCFLCSLVFFFLGGGCFTFFFLSFFSYLRFFLGFA